MAITLTVNKTNAACANICKGKATVTATAGATPYTFSWSDGATGASRTNLCAGSYTVTVTDIFETTAEITFSITTNPQVTLFAMPMSATSLLAVAGGGVPPYTFIWNTNPYQTTALATGLTPGNTYKVKATDSKGCSIVHTVQLDD